MGHVITQLGDLYQGLITSRREAGVQSPERSTQGRSISSGNTGIQYATHQSAGTNAALSGAIGSRSAEIPETNILELVTLVTDLFESQRQAGGLPVAERAAEEPMVPMGTDVLVDVLARLQRQFADNPVPDLQTEVDSSGKFKRAMNRQLGELEQRQQQQHQQAKVLDQHILNVVMRLFDSILQDPVMPAPMKVVIARLQIPILQLAVNDRVFLSDSAHPARNLLNSLSGAAVRWVDNGDATASSLYEMIEESVDRVISSPVQDKSLYAEVDRDFSEYLYSQEQAAAIAQERRNQLARGQESLAAAREKVSRELDRLMSNRMPVAVYNILNDVWRVVLTLSLLRDGNDDFSWTRMIGVAERLVDSVRLREEESERQKVVREIPSLLADLREGFFFISYDAGKTSSMFKQLQLCHISVSRGISPQM